MSDNLESYFRKYLKDETPAPDQWNIPSDNVWEKVQPEIGKRKGIFIPWKYFYIFGIGLVLLISTLVFLPDNRTELQANKNPVKTKAILTNKANTNASSPVSPIKDELESNRKNKPDVEISNPGVVPNQSKNENNHQSVSSKNASEIKYTDQHPTNNTGSIRNKSIDKKEDTSDRSFSAFATTNSKNATRQNKQKANAIDAKDLNAADFSQNKNDSFTISNTDNNHQINSNKIEIRDSYLSDSQFSALVINSNSINHFSENQWQGNLKGYAYLNSQKATPINHSFSKFGIAAYYAPTYSSTNVKGLELPENNQMGNTYLYSNNWGFDFNYYLSYRFTLVAGVGSSEIRSWSKTTSQFNYDLSTEQDMGNNQKANHTSQTSVTPLGILTSEVTFSFSADTNIPNGEIMESVSETFQNVRYLSIPLGFEYNLLKREKSIWFLETGVNYNLSIRDKTKIAPQVLHQGDEMNIMNTTITQDPDFKNNYWGYYIGTGVKIPLNSRIQLFGAIRYNISISPLKTIGSATTNVQGYQLKLGVAYLFN